MEKRFHSFAALTCEIFFPLEDKLLMFAPPCNILYISSKTGMMATFACVVKKRWRRTTGQFLVRTKIKKKGKKGKEKKCVTA